MINSSPLSVTTIKDFPSGVSPTSRALRIGRGGSSCGIVLLNLLCALARNAGGARPASEPDHAPAKSGGSTANIAIRRSETRRAAADLGLRRTVMSCVEPSQPEPATLGQLRAAGYVARPVKVELRDNLLQRLRSETTAFPGIVGFDLTVLPELESAILAGHDLVLLGAGQGKTRLMRTIAGLLDEWSPGVAGCEIHDDPYAPVCVRCRALAAELNDELPIEWRHRDERYTEKLATPDTSVGDLIGDVDPVKVAQGRTLGDPETVHYGLVPRSNRGVFGLNELPDLAERIQVALFNGSEERIFRTRLLAPTPAGCVPHCHRQPGGLHESGPDHHP